MLIYHYSETSQSVIMLSGDSRVGAETFSKMKRNQIKPSKTRNQLHIFGVVVPRNGLFAEFDKTCGIEQGIAFLKYNFGAISVRNKEIYELDAVDLMEGIYI